VAKAMNFRVTLREPTADFKWRGNVRELQRNGADFGVAHHFLTLEYHLLVDHLPAINNDYYCFLVPSAKPNPPWMSLLSPLSAQLWAGVILSFAICACLLSVNPFIKELRGIVAVFTLFGTSVENSQFNISKIK